MKTSTTEKRARDFRDTPIGEVLEQVKYDCALIQKDCERKDFKAALHGIQLQVEAFKELEDNLTKALQFRIV